MGSSAIPVVDFKEYGLHVDNPSSVSASVLEGTAEDLHNAFTSIGFCYIINHGIPQTAIDEMFSKTREFCNRPVEVKERYKGGFDVLCRWECEAESLDDAVHVADLKEFINFTPKESKSFMNEYPDLKLTLMEFYGRCKSLTERVLDVLSIGLKLKDRDFLRKCHNLIGQQGNSTVLRSIYYPPIPPQGAKPGQVRCGEHSDYGCMTLLFQDMIGGLEVQNNEGAYMSATPIPGAVLVNIGDMLQRWTSDTLRAMKHRVLVPEEELKKKQCRQSMAYFVNPNDEVIIKCLDGSEKYPSMSSIEYLNYRFSMTY